MTNRPSRLATAAIAVVCASIPVALLGQGSVPGHVTAAIRSFARPNPEMTLDAERKPAEVLAFTEVKAGGVVAEILNTDVYWTRLFSKAVGLQGQVYPVSLARGFRTYGPMHAAMQKAAAEAGQPRPFDSHGAALNVAFETDFKNVKAISQSIQSWDGNFGLPQQADLVFTRDAYHTFHNSMPSWGQPVFSKPFNMTEINRAIYRAMNPGAVYVISDFAAAPGAGFTVTQSLKRSDPEAVKAEVMAAGFEFAGSSDALANPADDRTKPADAIAKPDRYLLKFRKPRTAPAFDRRPKGEVLANWGRGWWENTMMMEPWEPMNHPSLPSTFFGGMWYHADTTLQERCCGTSGRGGAPNAGLILSTYFWDAQGHNCQYHEATMGQTVCHALETPEALNAEPGGYAFAYLNGFVDGPVSVRALIKGLVLPSPPPPNVAAWQATHAKNNKVPLIAADLVTSGKPAPKLAGLADSDYLYCRIADPAQRTVYFSNVILGDMAHEKRFAAAFESWVRTTYPGSAGTATCTSTKDFRQTLARLNVNRVADDKTFTREDTGWHYMIDGPFGFR